MDDYISTKQVASLLGVSVETVRGLASAGRLEGARRDRGRWLIPRQSVEAFRVQVNEDKSGPVELVATRLRSGKVIIGAMITAFTIMLSYGADRDPIDRFLFGPDIEESIASTKAAILSDGALSAMSQINERIFEESNDAYLYGLLGIAQIESGDYSSAVSSLRQAKELDRAFECYLGYALLYTSGTTEEVIDLAHKDLEHPSNESVEVCLELQVTALLLDGRPAESMTSFLTATLSEDKYADNVSLLSLSARLHMLVGDEETALRLVSRAHGIQRAYGRSDYISSTELALVETMLEMVDRLDQSIRDELYERLDRLSLEVPEDSILDHHLSYLMSLDSAHSAEDIEIVFANLRAAIRYSPSDFQSGLYRTQLASLLLAQTQIGADDGPDNFEEIEQLANEVVDDNLGHTFNYTAQGILALAYHSAGNEDEALNHYAIASDLQLEASWRYFPYIILEDTSVSSPAGPECNSSPSFKLCVPTGEIDPTPLVGHWRSSPDEAVQLYIMDDSLIYGIYSPRGGEMIGRMEDGVVRGLWCDTSSHGRQGGVFEIRIRNSSGKVELDGRWHFGVEMTGPWQEDWELEQVDSTDVNGLDERAGVHLSGCLPPSE